jgi:hypothetical protein
MPDNNQIRGPQFVQFFQPVIDALMELGGSGQPSEVKEVIADKLSIPTMNKLNRYQVARHDLVRTLIGQGFI